jgi:hypothetical protein
MYERRLQLLLDQGRYERVAARARRRNVSVATVIREAIDLAVPGDDADRRAAADAILSGPRVRLPDPDAVRADVLEAHDRV